MADKGYRYRVICPICNTYWGSIIFPIGVKEDEENILIKDEDYIKMLAERAGRCFCNFQLGEMFTEALKGGHSAFKEHFPTDVVEIEEEGHPVKEFSIPKESSKKMLVFTVGGSPEPIIFSFQQTEPSYTIFICSEGSKRTLEDEILPKLGLDERDYDVLCVPSENDYEECIDSMRRALTSKVAEWLNREGRRELVVDFTCGTKVMTAALALVSRRWQCRYNYIGGKKRTKDGLGVVIKGEEKEFVSVNPYKTLGMELFEEFIGFFNTGGYKEALSLIKDHISTVSSPESRSELTILRSLAEAYLFWDTFDHKRALEKLRTISGRVIMFVRARWSDREAEKIKRLLNDNIAFLTRLCDTDSVSVERIADLLANGLRCASAGRYDDGVARLYRAVEAVAQLRLKEYGIEDTSSVALKRIPESLREEFAHKVEDGRLRLGLQDCYRLLEGFGDALAQTFAEVGFADRVKTPLNIRNKSILAHGFESVTERGWRTLKEKVFQLLKRHDISEFSLPRFVKLPSLGITDE